MGREQPTADMINGTLEVMRQESNADGVFVVGKSGPSPIVARRLGIPEAQAAAAVRALRSLRIVGFPSRCDEANFLPQYAWPLLVPYAVVAYDANGYLVVVTEQGDGGDVASRDAE